MTTRRKLLAMLSAAAFAPRSALAQSKPPVLIGCLNVGSRQSQGHQVVAFKEALAALGWKEGASFVLDERFADGHYERLRPLAEELTAKKPAVIVAGPSQAVSAATKAAPRTPIVVAAGDPLAAGLVSNLARPGGMITGVTNMTSEVNEKHLELLLAAVPRRRRRIGFLGDPNNPGHAVMMEGARRAVAQHSVEGRFAEAARPEEIEPAVSRLAKEGVQALVVMAGPLFGAERQRIVKLAMTHRWPTIGGQLEWPEGGALLAYGPDRVALYRRAAWYVDRILKGAKPGDLPIEQPTKFELVVNMKMAKALGLTIPQPFLMRADRVIE